MTDNQKKLEKKVAKSKKGTNKTRTVVICAVAAVLLIAAAAVVLEFFPELFTKKNYYVDWKGYGKALAEIDKTYSDSDKVIIKIGDSEVKKSDYYRLKITDEYTFNALMQKYDDYYVNGAGKDATDEEKKAYLPERTTDEVIMRSLIELEMGYMEAMVSGVHMNFDIAFSQIQSAYTQFQTIIDMYEDSPDLEIYKNAKESVDEMQLIAEGMDCTVEDYIKYLADDTMKALAVVLLEEQWQEEFSDSDYEGTVDDYIEEKYNAVYEKYSVDYCDSELLIWD